MLGPGKPLPLRPGDSVRVVAPAGPFDRESFDKGLAVLSERYRVTYDPGIFSRDRYLAGADSRRLVELDHALRDPAYRAVFAARGGYGSMRLLPELALDTLPARLLVGFSDITALHLALQAAGHVSVHGPVLTQLGRAPAEAARWLFTLLETGFPPHPLGGAARLVSGTAEGPLMGGNLSVLTRLLGTPYFPSLQGSILLLEDVGERPYRLDRMWTHLALAGALRGLVGVAMGCFTGCDEPDGSCRAEDALRPLATALGLPCALGFRVGHEDNHRAVPLGTRVRLDADVGTLTFLEPLTAEVR
jgi:muramoyltetrapeptide carboxypeptidase